MEKLKFITPEIEEKLGLLFISKDDPDELLSLYNKIKEKRKKIKTFCEKHPEIGKIVQSWHERTSLHEEAWDLANLERHLNESKRNASLDEVLLPDNEQGEMSARIHPESLLNACKFVSLCSQKKSSEMVFSFHPEEYETLGSAMLLRAHAEMYAHLHGVDKNRIVKNRFRNEKDPLIVLPSAPFEPVKGEFVSTRVSLLLNWPETGWKHYNPIEQAALVTAEFWRIQPFMDGNKRMALLAANFILESAGLNRVVLTRADAKPFMENMKNAILTRDAHDLAKQYSEIILTRQEKMTDKIRENCLEERLGGKFIDDTEFES